MGKRTIKTDEKEVKSKAKKEQPASSEKSEQTAAPASSAKLSKKRVEAGILYVQSTYNNTKVLLSDTKGNALMWSSSGSLGFKGAKKGTPFAAAKVGEVLAEKAEPLGVKEIAVVVNGVGSGRESAIRGFVSRGIQISSIKDVTPVPHNGPKPPKPRRV